MNEYRNWDDVPDNLKTKTSLGRMGLRPAPGQQPTAVKTSSYHKTPDYDLYDVAEAIPKRKMTPKQQAALVKAQAASLEARTCKGCGFIEELGRPYRGKWYVKRGYCPACRQAKDEAEWIDSAHESAVAWARQLFDSGEFVIMDTETTGLAGEIIEMAVINSERQTLFNNRFKPLTLVDPEAAAIHGLTNDVLSSERPFAEFHEELGRILTSAPIVIIYNADFDDGRLQHTCDLHGLPAIEYNSDCAMDAYSRYVGELRWDGQFRWQPLPGGDHSALGDCLATLDILRRMAEPTAVTDN